jgi:hypothetical protein
MHKEFLSEYQMLGEEDLLPFVLYQDITKRKKNLFLFSNIHISYFIIS